VQAEQRRGKRRRGRRAVRWPLRQRDARHLTAKHEQHCNRREMEAQVDQPMAGRHVADRLAEDVRQREARLQQRSHVRRSAVPPRLQRCGCRIDGDADVVVELVRAVPRGRVAGGDQDEQRGEPPTLPIGAR
jgi:hypothetical protein